MRHCMPDCFSPSTDPDLRRPLRESRFFLVGGPLGSRLLSLVVVAVGAAAAAAPNRGLLETLLILRRSRGRLSGTSGCCSFLPPPLQDAHGTGFR